MFTMFLIVFGGGDCAQRHAVEMLTVFSSELGRSTSSGLFFECGDVRETQDASPQKE